ncbi:hypothetical protein CIRG_10224 [Coccidioides immitis RMSCC 2394]|uniref:Uncharacterized protein n=1 Tax=Coccidioides immitis RMSCC 2394 TaxID=404692 RepID=A0A0J6Y186_COCIT|nr:hypothetical protein CIRG_10224 [Coccidioides immitis RMSCC 2394]
MSGLMIVCESPWLAAKREPTYISSTSEPNSEYFQGLYLATWQRSQSHLKAHPIIDSPKEGIPIDIAILPQVLKLKHVIKLRPIVKSGPPEPLMRGLQSRI